MNDILRIISDTDQDRSNCDEWMREASNAEKILIWQAIQAMGPDPVSEIIASFAQLAFSEAYLRENS